MVVGGGWFRCRWILGEDGEAHEFGPRDQETMVRTVIEPMASEGLRTICLAYKDYVKGKFTRPARSSVRPGSVPSTRSDDFRKD